MGTIYKRGKILWIKYHRAGKPYYESTKSSKEADAKRLLKRREGEISEGKLPGIYFDKILYDELVADIVVDYELSGRKSLERLQNSLNHLEGDFSEIYRQADRRKSLECHYKPRTGGFQEDAYNRFTQHTTESP